MFRNDSIKRKHEKCFTICFLKIKERDYLGLGKKFDDGPSYTISH